MYADVLGVLPPLSFYYFIFFSRRWRFFRLHRRRQPVDVKPQWEVKNNRPKKKNTENSEQEQLISYKQDVGVALRRVLLSFTWFGRVLPSFSTLTWLNIVLQKLVSRICLISVVFLGGVGDVWGKFDFPYK